jgi:hypothetical protein
MYKPYVRTNTSKQAISFGAIDLWKDLPDITKNLPLFSFFKQVKTYLLAKQHTYWNLHRLWYKLYLLYILQLFY